MFRPPSDEELAAELEAANRDDPGWEFWAELFGSISFKRSTAGRTGGKGGSIKMPAVLLPVLIDAMGRAENEAELPGDAMRMIRVAFDEAQCDDPRWAVWYVGDNRKKAHRLAAMIDRSKVTEIPFRMWLSWFR